ncbi:MAG TPA: hypothetical protein VLQ80_03545, partial [Candidatus Saccharimonadia bacterium]|nr:hypothetical protein [Candidatus Saccharimonadia bacterium]
MHTLHTVFLFRPSPKVGKNPCIVEKHNRCISEAEGIAVSITTLFETLEKTGSDNSLLFHYLTPPAPR